MPSIQSHGGNCCGIRHMVGFGNTWNHRERPFTSADIKGYIDRNQFGSANGGRSQGKCIEAVVTDAQFRHHPELPELLAEAGFKLKTRFSNSSGTICNVLHRVSGGRDIVAASRRNTFLRPLLETA